MSNRQKNKDICKYLTNPLITIMLN